VWRLRRYLLDMDTGLGLGLQLRGSVCTRVQRTACRVGKQNRTDSGGCWNSRREFGRHTCQIAFGDAASLKLCATALCHAGYDTERLFVNSTMTAHTAMIRNGGPTNSEGNPQLASVKLRRN
jgi:hypothetical protein